MIRVILIDDHPLIRDGIKAIVGNAGDISVVGETGVPTEVKYLLQHIHRTSL